MKEGSRSGWRPIQRRKSISNIYMMELQKGEVCELFPMIICNSRKLSCQYIDATQKGGYARFVNHSCSPNCDIQQWTYVLSSLTLGFISSHLISTSVDKYLRMVLVAKCNIMKHEELTFNYNMGYLPYGDKLPNAFRYLTMFFSGCEAQRCYCKAKNCVGTIGLKAAPKGRVLFMGSFEVHWPSTGPRLTLPKVDSTPVVKDSQETSSARTAEWQRDLASSEKTAEDDSSRKRTRSR